MKNKLNILAALLIVAAGTVFGGIPVPHKNPNSIISPTAINCDGTGTLEFDGTTLVIDCANNRVAVGKSDPADPFVVRFDANDKGLVVINASTESNLFRVIRNASSDDSIIQAYSDGLVTIQLNSEGDSYLNSGNIGIGTVAPLAGLHVSTSSSFTEPATYVSSVTLKTVSRIEDTMTLSANSVGDLTWDAGGTILDGNTGYNVKLAANGQGHGLEVTTNGQVVFSSGVFKSTISINGSQVWQAGSSDAGLTLTRNDTGSTLWKAVRDGTSDGIILLGYDSNAIKFQIDASGPSYFNGGDVGIGVSPTLGLLHLDKGTGVGQITADGSTGGCIMLRDTDDAGWTECDALDGVLSCSIDADGACD